jgi:hypothetical protein
VSSDRNNIIVCDSDSDSWVAPCVLESHDRCESEACEIREYFNTYSEITSGQVKIGVATAISGLLVSSLFAIGILSMWCWHLVNGLPFPDIPLIIVSIAAAPFSAGVITTLRIPKKAKFKLGLNKGDNDG